MLQAVSEHAWALGAASTLGDCGASIYSDSAKAFELPGHVGEELRRREDYSGASQGLGIPIGEDFEESQEYGLRNSLLPSQTQPRQRKILEAFNVLPSCPSKKLEHTMECMRELHYTEWSFFHREHHLPDQQFSE